MVIYNKDQRSKDYGHIFDKFRPSHADYTFHVKYGNRDYRGGGRSSARETAARVAAGAVAQLLLRHYGISVKSYVSQVGHIVLDKPYQELDLQQIEANDVRCPDQATAAVMEKEILTVRKAGDTIGGVVSCVVTGVPVGWGEPVFDKLHADLGKAMLSINACKGFEYGSGFAGVTMRGSEHNDEFYTEADGTVRTTTNRSGGIQGGISNGEDIYFRAAFKSVATIIQDQTSVNEAGETVTVVGKGRHDPCVLPRAIAIVDNMTALVLADHCLRARANQL
jgi:chorismate synthase